MSVEGASERAEQASSSDASVPQDALEAISAELDGIDERTPRERAELLERVQQVVAAELAALDGL